VDIGGADGLIHLSEISWKRVGHPSEVLKVGDIINVYVLSVDPNERKIALSLKRTQPEPWSTITENYKLGQIVRGTITQLTTFGAFARLDDGIEGLIHVSELAEGRVAHPKNVVNVGDVLDLKVIRIDPIKRRIGLSLKRVHEDENEEFGGTEGLAAGEGESAASTAPTGGASGEDNVAPMGQVETTEAHSQEAQQAETMTPAPASERTERFERQSRAERPERTDRGSRQQNRQGGAAGDRQAAGDEAPLGALAQALGAYMNRDEDEVEGQPEESAPESETEDTAPEASAPEAEAEETAPEENAPETEVEQSAPEESSPEEGSAEESTSEAETEESAPDADAEESAPEPEAEESASESETEDTAPEAEAETEESAPETEEEKES
jgi:predicted RNA-binding protein with RPS1 domain